ncbi:MAG: hypothetical protein AUJ12_03565 [Alphaproteobacteria bacterium CG1_02_46_17]|nr:MAG: hypothetical protein AUJ12_03565 [Alphaproteobacteria bacterium CG1_02_46_17]
MTIISTYSSYGSSSVGVSTTKNASTSTSKPSSQINDAITQFLEYQKMTPEEKMRDAILKKLGMTEEDIAALSPDERAKIEEKIKDMIKEEIENKMAEKGILIDLSS